MREKLLEMVTEERGARIQKVVRQVTMIGVVADVSLYRLTHWNRNQQVSSILNIQHFYYQRKVRPCRLQLADPSATAHVEYQGAHLLVICLSLTLPVISTPGQLSSWFQC